MITKTDLDQILNGVRKIVREEVVAEVQSAKDDMESTMLGWRMSIQTDIRTLADRIKDLDIRVTRNHKELKDEIKQVSHFQDVANLQTAKRVDRVEKILSLPPME